MLSLEVGGGLLALLAAILLGFVLVRRKIRKFADQFVNELAGMIEAMESIPPMRLRLESQEEILWLDLDTVNEFQSTFRKQGFELIDDFEAINDLHEMEYMNVQAYCHPKKNAYAIIYEAGQIGVWVDVVSVYEDGSRFCICWQVDDLMDQPPQVQIEFLPDCLPSYLADTFFSHRSQGSFASMSADLFVADFENAHAALMDWRMERGGPTAEELQRIAKRAGQETTEDEISTTQAYWNDSYCEFLDYELGENLHKERKMSEEDWESINESILFVHDKLSPEAVIELFGYAFEEEEPFEKFYQEMLPKFKENSPRSVFAEINSSGKFRHIYGDYGQIAEPIEADVYLIPESAFEDEE
ncbi:MAG: hypothetical protein COA78_34520 [Blastopirellula sp.]|nr:MAG: hypothetical protein COA78_34520 [Blastopirellula sp.]